MQTTDMVDIKTLSRYNPNAFIAGEPDDYSNRVCATARFALDCELDLFSSVGERSTVGSRAFLGRYVYLGEDVHVQGRSRIHDDVSISGATVIGEDVVLTNNLVLEGDGNYFAKGSRVDELDKPDAWNHYYQRRINAGAVIGKDVVLPSEVQLGSEAVIPTSDTVAQIGRFGEHRRMVTIYGSNEGPLFGVGCQFGISEEEFSQRINVHTDTSENSAADYGRHWDEITQKARNVQAAYDREESQIGELLDMRNEAFAAHGLTW